MLRRPFLAACAGLPFASGAFGQPAAGPSGDRRVGINLAGLAYWTSEFPFADLVKNSGDWHAQVNGKDGAMPPLRPDGYPARLDKGQLVRRPLGWDNGSGYAAGSYVALYEGDGKLAFPLTSAKVTSESPGRVVVDVQPTSQFWVAITSTNPADPVRNLRVLWPGTESGHARNPFNPEFVKRMAPFKAVRFMDWGATNHSKVVEWKDRTQVDDITYAERAVPVERMVDLANLLEADPWFCVPHQASDDYVRQLGSLVATRLDPRRKVWIEYSNEVWNQAFEQCKWALEQSRRNGLPTPANLPSAFYAERSAAVFYLFRQAFGPDAARRTLRVIGGQAAWTQFQDHALGWKSTARQADALAIAPYFGAGRAGDPKNVAETVTLAPEALIEQMLTTIRTETRRWIAQNAALARKHNLGLVAYEGGAGDTVIQFAGQYHEPLMQLFAATHRHPRMREVYGEYLSTWAAEGGGLFNQFNDIGIWGKWGLWGLLESVTQDVSRSPKYQGVLDFIAGRAPAARK